MVSKLYEDIRVTGDGVGLPIRKPDARAVGNDEVDMTPLGNPDQVGVVQFEPGTWTPVKINHRSAQQVAVFGVPYRASVAQFELTFSLD